MKLVDLTKTELQLIEGGLDSDYNAGYAVGKWLRNAVQAIGDLRSAFAF